MINPKFNEAKERLINSAQRVAGAYLLSKYGSAHLAGEPKVELTTTQGPTSSSFVFSGQITCFAADGLLNQVGVNMTVNENDIQVESETIQADITEALNAQRDHTDKVLAASLDGFKLNDDGSKYFKVSHSDLQDANLGIVGKNEYEASPNKSELLQSIVKDAMLETPISFTGEFKEPVIAKSASWLEDIKCEDCKAVSSGHDRKHYCEKHQPKNDKEASLQTEIKPQAKKSSWLTAELLTIAEDQSDEMIADECDTCKNAQSSCKCASLVEVATVSITDDIPMARMADHLAQSAQLEEQSGLAAQAKVEHEAANALMALLQGMGYGSAKIVESSRSNDGLDFMAAIDDAGSVKAVSIPVVIKDAKVVLPKKSLISTLVSKGLDVKAKLAEQFDMDVLEKLAAIEEKIAYEAKEAENILNERPTSVEKVANEGKNTMFEGDTDTLTVQKHLLPNHEDMKVGDKISDGSDQWELVNTGGQQNSKGEDDGSLWTMKKCQAPARSDEEPKNKMPI